MADRVYDDRALARGTSMSGDVRTRQLFDELASWDEEFSALFQRFVFGGLYDRDVLDQKTRELCAIAGLICQNALPQLRSHVLAAMNLGASRAEVMEVCLQMCVYAGVPYALQAARLVAQVFKDMDTAGATQQTH